MVNTQKYTHGGALSRRIGCSEQARFRERKELATALRRAHSQAVKDDAHPLSSGGRLFGDSFWFRVARRMTAAARREILKGVSL